MNTDTKWEAVEYGDLKPSDKVRLTHENGNVIHGEVYKDGKYIEADAVGHWAARFQEEGYSFERAVPERTLPTEPGRYIAASMASSPHMANIMTLRSNGVWDDESTALEIEPLVRLVPVTEVEELRRRISAGKSFIRATWGGQSVTHDRLIDLLDGEV